MEVFFTRHTRLFFSFVRPGKSHAVLSVFFDYGIPPHGVAPARFSCCSSSGKEGCREYRKAPPELLRRGFAFDHIKCHRQVWNTWGCGAQDVRKGITIERKPLKKANSIGKILRQLFVSASATDCTRDFCGLFPLHIAKYAANRCIYSTNLSIPFCTAPL